MEGYDCPNRNVVSSRWNRDCVARNNIWWLTVTLQTISCSWTLWLVCDMSSLKHSNDVAWVFNWISRKHWIRPGAKCPWGELTKGWNLHETSSYHCAVHGVMRANCRGSQPVVRWLDAHSRGEWQPCRSQHELPTRWQRNSATRWATASGLKTARQRGQSSSIWLTACYWESSSVSRTLPTTGLSVRMSTCCLVI